MDFTCRSPQDGHTLSEAKKKKKARIITKQSHNQSFCNIICVAFADIQVTHSSTLERRLPVHLHPQPAAPPPSVLAQQDVDSEMVEILI